MLYVLAKRHQFTDTSRNAIRVPNSGRMMGGIGDEAMRGAEFKAKGFGN